MTKVETPKKDKVRHGADDFMHTRTITWKDVNSVDTLVQHPHFEIFFVTLIMLSAFVTAFELQYQGLDRAYRYGLPVIDHSGISAEEIFPGAIPVLNAPVLRGGAAWRVLRGGP